jgi:Protein of unknown function (DUF3306)
MSRPDDSKPGESVGFLDRWARRKQEVLRAQESQQNQTSAVRAAPAAHMPVEAAESLPLPSLDDIVPGGDVAAFFQKHVPEALRAAALRKVWMTDPDIKDFIEMADYQLDYANPDSIPGWSSNIEGIDLKGMVERIFNNAPEVEAESPVLPGETAVETPGVEDAAANGATEPVHTHSTLVETSDDPSRLQAPRDVIQNGAVQNKQEESVVYETARKRHGGALPS